MPRSERGFSGKNVIAAPSSVSTPKAAVRPRASIGKNPIRRGYAPSTVSHQQTRSTKGTTLGTEAISQGTPTLSEKGRECIVGNEGHHQTDGPVGWSQETKTTYPTA